MAVLCWRCDRRARPQPGASVRRERDRRRHHALTALSSDSLSATGSQHKFLGLRLHGSVQPVQRCVTDQWSGLGRECHEVGGSRARFGHSVHCCPSSIIVDLQAGTLGFAVDGTVQGGGVIFRNIKGKKVRCFVQEARVADGSCAFVVAAVLGRVVRVPVAGHDHGLHSQALLITRVLVSFFLSENELRATSIKMIRIVCTAVRLMAPNRTCELNRAVAKLGLRLHDFCKAVSPFCMHHMA